MPPDLRFFQAAATVIPTLLVAAVFTAKAVNHKPYEEARPGRWWLQAVANVLIGLVLFGAAVRGEAVSLDVLSRGMATAEDLAAVETALRVEGGALLLAVGSLLHGDLLQHLEKIENRMIRHFVEGAMGLSSWGIVLFYIAVTTRRS